MINKKLTNDDKVKRVEIIVLKYNRPDCEKECVNAIIEHTSHPYKLNLYDNRLNSANMSKIWNKLIRESTCEYVLVMDSDAFPQHDRWLEMLVECFEMYPKCGYAVPVIGQSGGPKVQQHELSGAHPERINGHASGFCFLTKKSIVEDMGWFDEDFYIFGQDSDFLERVMRESEYEIYVARRSFVKHGHLINENKHSGLEEVWEFSNSTRKASEAGEFVWKLDTTFCSHLLDSKYKNYYDKGKKG